MTLNAALLFHDYNTKTSLSADLLGLPHMTISGVYGELSKKVKYLLSSISMSKNAVLMPVVRGQGTRLF